MESGNHQRNTPEHVARAIERALRSNWVTESALRNRLEKRLRELRELDEHVQSLSRCDER